jgi:hypothetical protein
MYELVGALDQQRRTWPGEDEREWLPALGWAGRSRASASVS